MKNRNCVIIRVVTRVAVMMAICILPLSAWGAATIVIVNADPANVGFNDPAVVAPVGGNTGTTLGQQRLNAFQAAADKWGATLTSVPIIRVNANWIALSCTATSAVLGSAGATEVFRDFPGATQAGTWFSAALTNKLFGATADPATPEIAAHFNVNLGQPGCLTGFPFYLGLDNNHGNLIDLVTVLTHEFGHGLGFQTFTNGATGVFLAGFPSIYDWFALDTTSNLLWKDMPNNSDRVASALNSRKLVWNGLNVTTNAPTVLAIGTPQLTVVAPGTGTSSYPVGTASFGPLLTSPGVTGQLMPVVDTTATGAACTPLTGANALAANGNIALIDRGVCTFVTKVKNAQNAGAIGVVIANNVAGSPPPGLGGTDPTITIPTVEITQADGATLKSALKYRSRTKSGVVATIGINGSQLQGADPLGRVLLYTPAPYQQGSSVSHWDTSTFPNQLMEPAINDDLTHEVTPPQDLTFPLLKDIGW